MKKYFLLFVTLAYSIVNAQNGFEITGQLKDVSNEAIVSLLYQDQILDSCLIENNQFTLKGKLPLGPNDVLLRVQDDNTTLQAPLFIGNEKVSIQASKEDFPYNIQAKGSLYDGDRLQYMQSIKAKPQETLNDLTLQFIYTHIHTPFGLKLLDLAKENFKKDELRSLLEQVDPSLQQSSAAWSVQQYLQLLDLEPGDSFINFQAFEANQSDFEFSKTFDGKHVLLVFSSLYCHWCTQTLPLLEKLQNQTASALRIVVFYMDDDLDGQGDFSKKSANPWSSVWDPTRTYNSYMNYAIQSTPTFYLFDPKGKLVEKVEGFTPTLDELIQAKIK